MELSHKQSFTLHTPMSKHDTISLIKANTSQTNTSLFWAGFSVDKNLPFYGSINEDAFKLHTIAYNGGTHLMMALNGNVEESIDGADIIVNTRGLSKFMLFNIIFSSIVIALIGYFASTTLAPELSGQIITMFSFVIIANIVLFYIYPLYYINKAKQALYKLFEQQ